MDFYKILGVSRSAHRDEIKYAYFKILQKEHPDKQTTAEERSAAHERMVTEVIPAYETLSDDKKRKKYDATLPPEENLGEGSNISQKENVGRSGTQNSGKKVSEEEYREFFREKASKFGWRNETITIPESDWGLLAGLVRAYSSNKYEAFAVDKVKDDHRDWMPKHIYLIESYPKVMHRIYPNRVLDKGDIEVGRTVVDWLPEEERKNALSLTHQHDIRSTNLPPGSYISASILKEAGILINGRNCFSFSEYVKALKGIAHQIVYREESNDVLDDLMSTFTINRYGKSPLQNVRVEGIQALSNDEEREWVKPVKPADFFIRLKEAEAHVHQIENVRRTSEGTLLLPANNNASENKG